MNLFLFSSQTAPQRLVPQRREAKIKKCLGKDFELNSRFYFFLAKRTAVCAVLFFSSSFLSSFFFLAARLGDELTTKGEKASRLRRASTLLSSVDWLLSCCERRRKGKDTGASEQKKNEQTMRVDIIFLCIAGAFLAAITLPMGVHGAQNLTLAHYLKANNTAANSQFGRRVAIASVSPSESLVVASDLSGTASVFSCTASMCSLFAVLEANSTAVGRLECAVAVASLSPLESIVVTGVRSPSTGTSAAHVFVCNTATGCTLLSNLKSRNSGPSGDSFGRSVSVASAASSKITVVVGAASDDSCATGVNGNASNNDCGSSGAAYVFTCNTATGCAQLVYLKASNTGAGDFFGSTVAVAASSPTESTVVVGAFQESSCAAGVDSDGSDENCFAAGAAYVFSCNMTGCAQLAYLKANNTDQGDEFGYSVAVASAGPSESTVVVGARHEDSCSTGIDGNYSNDGCPYAGAAYVFTCTAAGCTQFAYLKSSNTDGIDAFGSSIAIASQSSTESTVVVGAIGESSCGTTINADGRNNNCPYSGAAYMFACSTTKGCASREYLKASNTWNSYRLGFAVAVAQNTASDITVVVGAAGEGGCGTCINGKPDYRCFGAGAAYVFGRGSMPGTTLITQWNCSLGSTAGTILGSTGAKSTGSTGLTDSTGSTGSPGFIGSTGSTTATGTIRPTATAGTSTTDTSSVSFASMQTPVWGLIIATCGILGLCLSRAVVS
jgi:hypothetical protein